LPARALVPAIAGGVGVRSHTSRGALLKMLNISEQIQALDVAEALQAEVGLLK